MHTMNGTEEENFVTPGEVLGKASELKPGNGAYFSPEDKKVYASLTGFRSVIPAPAGSHDPVIKWSSVNFADFGLRVRFFCLMVLSAFSLEFICG